MNTAKDSNPPQKPTALCVASLLRSGDFQKLAARLGFGNAATKIPPSAFPTWGWPESLADEVELSVVTAIEGFRLVIARGSLARRERRRMMIDLRRRNPTELTTWWWVEPRTVTVAIVSSRDDGRPFIRSMVTDRHAPDPAGLEQWRALQIHDPASPDVDDPVDSLRRHLDEVLRQDTLTREFFVGFRDVLTAMRTQMLHGPDDERQRHDIALTTLLRLVFVYFLQKKGALDGDHRFVIRQKRQAHNEGRSFYRTTLRPLFFGALNTPPEERSTVVSELGDFPFLNGGLFEPIPAERSSPRLDWPREIWTRVIDELLERYHFVAAEPGGDEEQRAVDPEMLGKVFEGLMFGESRANSGSFYTPRDVVRGMVESALIAHLRARTAIEEDRLRALFSEPGPQLRENETDAIRGALEKITILDPAVGTGAFLLEALHLLSQLHRTINDTPVDFETMRYLVHHHLFGVDVQYSAIRLCELRLWIALLTALPDASIDHVPPLPNLGHRICTGNSLLEPADLVGLTTGDRGVTWIGPGYETDRKTRERLRDLQSRYLTEHGDEKTKLRRQIEDIERRLQIELLHAREYRLEAYLTPLERLQSSRDLFGEQVELETGQRREHDRLMRELEAIRLRLQELKEQRSGHLSFGYWTRFADVMSEGGFDIVVTNPPWVRTHRIDEATRNLLQARYLSTDNRLWNEASELGIRAPFGTQVDLAAIFLERSIELLRPGGHLAALVPSKLFRSLHGSRLRRLLLDHRVEALEDCSDARKPMFEATTYPAILHLTRRGDESPESPGKRGEARRPRARPIRMSVWHGRSRSTWETTDSALPAIGESGGEPWMLVEPEVRRVFDKMWSQSRPLGKIDGLRPTRGIFTGCNEVFIRPPGEFERIIGPEAKAYTRPILAGRDLSSDAPKPENEILWIYESGTLLDEAPETIAEYFFEHEERLGARADHVPDSPPWQVFRVREELFQHKLVWRDIAPFLQASTVDRDVIPLNTVYFLPFEERSDARSMERLFNATPLRAFAYALGERARGGWRRHFAWVVRMLPVPTRGEFDLDASELRVLERWLRDVLPDGEEAA